MPLKIGNKAIPFSLPGVDGQDYSLGDAMDGKGVIVVFSCNHCPYVRAYEDRMIKIQADYGPQGIPMLAINSNDSVKYPADSFDSMKARAQEKGFNFPYLHDETQEVARQYGAERTPEFFLFDSDGTLKYHGALDDNYDDPTAVKKSYLRDAIDALLTNQTPATMNTAPVGCTIKWK